MTNSFSHRPFFCRFCRFRRFRRFRDLSRGRGGLRLVFAARSRAARSRSDRASRGERKRRGENGHPALDVGHADHRLFLSI